MNEGEKTALCSLRSLSRNFSRSSSFGGRLAQAPLALPKAKRRANGAWGHAPSTQVSSRYRPAQPGALASVKTQGSEIVANRHDPSRQYRGLFRGPGREKGALGLRAQPQRRWLFAGAGPPSTFAKATADTVGPVRSGVTPPPLRQTGWRRWRLRRTRSSRCS